jgi:hypothetical protein
MSKMPEPLPAIKVPKPLPESIRDLMISISDGLIEFEDWILFPLQSPLPRPEKIIINENTMVVIWDDGEKSKSTCAKDDIFDRNIGFAMCLAKRLYGKKHLARMLKSKKLVFVQQPKPKATK